jgi:multiple sugar transport system substrate-binding protein
VTDLELSVMAHSPTTERDLRPFLAKFEAQHRVKVKVRVFSWETGWTELVKFALYGHGPDVSEIGSTWVSTLAATDTLQRFGVRETAAVGGRDSFLHPSWQSCFMAGRSDMWAIPWLSNVRLVFYRRDRLHHAGIAQPVSFRSPSTFLHLLSQLQTAGDVLPLALATHNTVNALHDAAMWVWGAGSQFIALDGRHTRFSDIDSRMALQAYFDLHQYLVPAARNLNDQEVDHLFLRGQAAMTISDPGLLRALSSGAAVPEVAANTGTALPPGVPFVGGSNLVVWQHSRQQKLAFELVCFLTSQPVQIDYSQQARSLPVRLDALASAPFSTDPLYKSVVDALKMGRSYQVNRLWGMIEEKLVAELNLIWAEILTQPPADLDALLMQHLKPLAETLDLVLSSDLRK